MLLKRSVNWTKSRGDSEIKWGNVQYYHKTFLKSLLFVESEDASIEEFFLKCFVRKLLTFYGWGGWRRYWLSRNRTWGGRHTHRWPSWTCSLSKQSGQSKTPHSLGGRFESWCQSNSFMGAFLFEARCQDHRGGGEWGQAGQTQLSGRSTFHS